MIDNRTNIWSMRKQCIELSIRGAGGLEQSDTRDGQSMECVGWSRQQPAPSQALY